MDHMLVSGKAVDDMNEELAKLSAELDAMQHQAVERTSELIALREQLAAAQTTIANLEQTARNATLHWNAVAEQLAAAQKDAERYRFAKIRAYVGVNPHAKTCLWVLRGIFEVPGKDFDAAIDAAMKGQA